MKLTEKEFDMLIEALEQLPNKSQDGKLAARLMAKMLPGNDEEALKKAEADMNHHDMMEEAKCKETKKKCGIITGKLYMMKEQIVEEYK